MGTRGCRYAFTFALIGALVVVLGPAVAQAGSSHRDEAVAWKSLGRLLAQGTVLVIRNASADSNRVLQPSGGVQANGVSLVVANQSGGGISPNYQRWRTVGGDGVVSFWSIGTENPFLNMGIDRASTASGANAILAASDGHANQDWNLNPRGDGTLVRLRNAHSDKCLGVSGGVGGTQVQQFTCDENINQRWFLERIV